LLAGAIFTMTLPAAAFDFSWLTGPWSGKVIDFESQTPVADALVAGVFGEWKSGLAGHHFFCQSIEVLKTNDKGEYRFTPRQQPHSVFAFKEGYWFKHTASFSRSPLPFALTRNDPHPRASGSPPPAFYETPLYRRLDLGRQLGLACESSKVLWRDARLFLAAIARDGATSAQTPEERLYALSLCRNAVHDGDDGGRMPAMNPRAAFTGLEAQRLRERAPECLAPALLATKVNEGAAPNTWRTPIDLDDPRFLSTAIVDDPAASAKRMEALNVTSSGCRHDPDPEAFVCCVYPAPTGGTEAGKVMRDALKETGIPHIADKSGRGACVRKKDESKASDAASKANAYIRNRP
jgi:hypothetical protein